MKNINFMAAFAVFLLVSCKHDSDVKFANAEGEKVTFSASINDPSSEDVSRVSGVNWEDGDIVSISCGPTQSNVSYRYNAGDNSFTSVNEFDEIWLMGNDEYDVTAYYPFIGTEGTVPPVQSVEITSDNQATSEEREKFDFLYAATKATKAEPNVHLSFNHVMSRVNLKFVPGTDPDGNPVTLTNIECYLEGVKLQGTFNTTTGEAAVAEDATTGDLRQILTADNDYTFTAYLLPQTIGTEGIKIEAAMSTADGRRIYYYLEVPATDWPELKSGYSYNYTLTANDYMTVSPTLLELSGMAINPWADINKEEIPEAKALGTEAHVNDATWGDMENEEIIPVVK
ncbi:fimbrillin family protein [uncultured Bacteroides sp.]|uniref:fimbrillin family protein n=1 Tax=uncultured Bacteroides sp. TaxID=162156 RepID=UPI00280A50A6|nr:fimbrillin family protein [uncultured Bacteroides sp.]